MSTLLSYPPAVYSFRNIDLVYDFLVSIGMKPYVELRYVVTCVMARPDHAPDLAAYSFMPNAIASGNQTVFHYDGAHCPFPFAQHEDHIDCTPFDRTRT